jgi:DNA-3-methyladenine glycosylase
MTEESVLTHYKLDRRFYERTNCIVIAKDLLGKILVTNINKKITAGRIVETEAYNGIIDKASHAFGNRKTNRTKIMYGNGGTAYVYLCYGIHHLFNVVTNTINIPQAVLIRAVEPVVGIDEMLKRTHKAQLDFTLTRGPGNASKALGITTNFSGADLCGDEIFIIDDNFILKKKDIETTARIGVDYAGDDALLPYRFYIKNNKFVSRVS